MSSPPLPFRFEATVPEPSRRAGHRGRTGRLHTPHGTVDTPAFIFCATKAAIKGMSPEALRQEGTQIILSNTFHLMLQPGAGRVDQMGGLQAWTGWHGPMLTDSGGFQIFSLGHGSVAAEIKGNRFPKTGEYQPRPGTVRVDEEGARFVSYRDGSVWTLTPEESIRIQRALGADLVVVFDECTPFHVEKSCTEASMHRSHRWALRSRAEFMKPHPRPQALYGIVQGGVYEDLRRESAAFVSGQDFFGWAVGGSLGATPSQMHDVVSMTMACLPASHPVHLLGIGRFADILHGVRCGIDTFDCVHPTRLARHGGALVPAPVRAEAGVRNLREREHINLRNSCFQDDTAPIDPTCPCASCRTFSRAYIHHLLKAGEMLGVQAITVHNVRTMNRFMEDIRASLTSGTLDDVDRFWSGAQDAV